MQHRRTVAIAAAVLGFLLGAIPVGGQLLARTPRAGPGDPILPVVLSGGLLFLLSPVAIFGLGYWTGGRVDVPDTYLELAATMGVAAGVAALVGQLLAVALGMGGILEPLLRVLVPSLFNGAVRGVDVAVTGLAGAAVAHFRGD